MFGKVGGASSMWEEMGRSGVEEGDMLEHGVSLDSLG